MTNAYFCDIHPEEKTSLIRGDKKNVSTLVIQTIVQEVGKDGKRVTWTREGKLNACAKCMQSSIYERAKALGVELDWVEWRLTKDANGNYKRVTRSTEEAPAEETPLAA